MRLGEQVVAYLRGFDLETLSCRQFHAPILARINSGRRDVVPTWKSELRGAGADQARPGAWTTRTANTATSNDRTTGPTGTPRAVTRIAPLIAERPALQPRAALLRCVSACNIDPLTEGIGVQN